MSMLKLAAPLYGEDHELVRLAARAKIDGFYMSPQDLENHLYNPGQINLDLCIRMCQATHDEEDELITRLYNEGSVMFIHIRSLIGHGFCISEKNPLREKIGMVI